MIKGDVWVKHAYDKTAPGTPSCIRYEMSREEQYCVTIERTKSKLS
jgi:hypothetical protein